MMVCWLMWAPPQPDNFWHVLAQVGFEKKQGIHGWTVEVPVFSQHVKSWNGKRITLKGYILPAGEVGSTRYMFSSQPFNLCYFCGAAGPETVVELDTSQKIAFSSQPMTITGILVLNAADEDRHMYILTTVHVQQR